MDGDKVAEVLEFYRSELAKVEIKPSKLENHEKLIDDGNRVEAFQHLAWMCEEATRHVNSGRVEKAFRWLGCIQGALWMIGLYSLEELKEHSRPRCPECSKPLEACSC